MIFFLGCDVAKNKLDVSLVNEQGVEQWIDQVPNDVDVLTSFLLTLGDYYAADKLTCVVEPTGRYHYTLLEAAIAANVPIKVYNSILTKQGIKASIRGKKTDRTDALLIARLGLRGEGRLYTGEQFMTTKLHARSYQKLGVMSTVLTHHTEHLNAMHTDGLAASLQDVFDAIQASITAARKALYKELTVSASGATFTRLQTIPGIGPYVAASLIGEIQSMERFTDAHALTAFAGLDPRIRQSGKVLNSTGKLTKRGSSYLRRSIFIAAHVAKRCDPNMRALYNKKRIEGKSYTAATVVVARKLLAITRAVWLSEKDYDPIFVSTNS